MGKTTPVEIESDDAFQTGLLGLRGEVEMIVGFSTLRNFGTLSVTRSSGINRVSPCPI